MEEADEFMPVHLTQSIFNWCQDFEEKLFNMGLVDSTYFQKRREYCREFCQVFPESDSDSLIIQDMLRAEAESYAALGNMETSQNLFQKLTQRFPDEVWGYIGWGDIYWIHTTDEPDYRKAEEIYRMGLAKCKNDKDNDILYERLEDLEDHMSGWE